MLSAIDIIRRASGHPFEARESLRAPSQQLIEALGADQTASGVSVDGDLALRYADVYAAIRVLSDAAASLPLHVYRRTGDGRAKVNSGIATSLLRNPSPTMTQSALIGAIVTNLNAWGNAYLTKLRDQRGQIVQIGFLHPRRVAVGTTMGEPVFRVSADPSRDRVEGSFNRRDIIHIKGMTTDGLLGLSPVRQAREAIAAAISLEEYGGRFFSNSATPRGVLKIPGELGEEAAKRLSDSWNSAHQGRANMHKVAVLEAGAEFQAISMPLEDAQFVEQRKLSATQIARIFRIPPSMIGAESGSSMTYSNVEQESLNFVTHSLRPWLVCIEQALAADEDLFDRLGGTYPEFTLDALLRADSKTRAEVYRLALDPVTGWMNRPEIRDLENLPAEPIPTPVGG